MLLAGDHCFSTFLKRYYLKQLNLYEGRAVVCAHVCASPAGDFSTLAVQRLYRGLSHQRLAESVIPMLLRNVGGKGFYAWDEKAKRGQVTDAGLLFIARLNEWPTFYFGDEGPGLRYLGKHCPIDFNKRPI